MTDDDQGVELATITVTRWVDQDGTDRFTVACSDGMKTIEALGMLTQAQLALWEQSEDPN